MGEPVLEIRNVTNGVLQDLNLIVEKGDFYYWICFQKKLDNSRSGTEEVLKFQKHQDFGARI